MDLDALLQHYFGTSRLETLDAAGFDLGLERVGTAFGTERDPARRFALWAVLHALGEAPDPATAFKDPRERQAAEAYARGMRRAGPPE